MDIRPYGLAVKAFVIDAQGRWLLIRRSMQSKHFRGQWDLPGGKVDAGEAFDAALVREVAEETGLEVSVEGVAGAAQYDMERVRVVLLYLLARAGGGEVRLSAEHDDCVWAAPGDLAGMDLSEQLRPFTLPYAASAGGRPGA